MKKIILLLIILWLFDQFQSKAQALLPPLEEMPLSRQAYLILKNGNRITGEVMNTTSGRGINKVVIRDDSSDKNEFKEYYWED
jgi:hypothetical protein